MNFSPNSQDDMPSRFFQLSIKEYTFVLLLFVMEDHSNKQPNRTPLMLFSRANSPCEFMFTFQWYISWNSLWFFLSHRFIGMVRLKFQGKIFSIYISIFISWSRAPMQTSLQISCLFSLSIEKLSEFGNLHKTSCTVSCYRKGDESKTYINSSEWRCFYFV